MSPRDWNNSAHPKNEEKLAGQLTSFWRIPGCMQAACMQKRSAWESIFLRRNQWIRRVRPYGPQIEIAGCWPTSQNAAQEA